MHSATRLFRTLQANGCWQTSHTKSSAKDNQRKKETRRLRLMSSGKASEYKPSQKTFSAGESPPLSCPVQPAPRPAPADNVVFCEPYHISVVGSSASSHGMRFSSLPPSDHLQRQLRVKPKSSINKRCCCQPTFPHTPKSSELSFKRKIPRTLSKSSKPERESKKIHCGLRANRLKLFFGHKGKSPLPDPRRPSSPLCSSALYDFIDLVF